MSFLSGLGGLGGQIGAGLSATGLGGAAGAAAGPANWAASGLGKLIGVDPAKISSIANSIGGGMNQIAQGGGAAPSYAAPELPAPAVNNHMQLLDPRILQALVQHFSGGGQGAIR